MNQHVPFACTWSPSNEGNPLVFCWIVVTLLWPGRDSHVFLMERMSQQHDWRNSMTWLANTFQTFFGDIFDISFHIFRVHFSKTRPARHFLVSRRAQNHMSPGSSEPLCCQWLWAWLLLVICVARAMTTEWLPRTGRPWLDHGDAMDRLGSWAVYRIPSWLSLFGRKCLTEWTELHGIMQLNYSHANGKIDENSVSHKSFCCRRCLGGARQICRRHHWGQQRLWFQSAGIACKFD